MNFCVALQWYSNLNVSFIRFSVLSVLLQPKKTLVGCGTEDWEKYFDIYVPPTTEKPNRKRNDLNAISIWVRSFTATELPFQMNYMPHKSANLKWCWIHKTKWFIHSNRNATVRFIFNNARCQKWLKHMKIKENLECKIMRHNILRHFKCYVINCNNAKQLA